MIRCEVYSGKASVKARRILDAMCRAAANQGVAIIKTRKYTGDHPWYMTWGLGHPERRLWTNAHTANGGHVIAFDLGYWDRENKFRLTIDADHATALVRDMPHTRMDGITFRDDYNPNGHIVIVGLGKKSRGVYPGSIDWESRAIQRAQEAYPGRPVVVRHKGLMTPIEPVIAGASLVVCRHSNVALDACIAGVPVVCEDGIASTLYGSDIRNPLKPTLEQRRQLIANAGWWQWAPSEAGQAWQFIRSVL